MPIVDGFVLLHTLAAKPGRNRETPIYVITADTSEQARVRALKRRAVFMLTKPVPIATLTSLVEAALKKAAARGSAPPEADEDEVLDVDPLLHTASAPPSSLPTKPASAARPPLAQPGRMTPPIRPSAPDGPPRKPGG